jgi:hypothetical protein
MARKSQIEGFAFHQQQSIRGMREENPNGARARESASGIASNVFIAARRMRELCLRLKASHQMSHTILVARYTCQKPRHRQTAVVR